MKHLSLLLGLTLGLTTSVPGNSNEPSLADVLKSTPKPANAVMHADLDALRKLTFGTPLEMDLPAQVQRIRIAAEIDLARLQPDWEIGYAAMKSLPNADAVAKLTGGYVDKVGNFDAVWTPNQMYLVPLPSSVLSLVRPTDRKFLSQWLRKERSSSPSAFLTAAASNSTENLAVLISVDLEDVISAATLAEYLPEFKSLQGKNVSAVAGSLSRIRGVTLAIPKDSFSQCTISLSFREPPTELQPIAKEFFNEMLQRRGSAIGDISAWKVAMKDRSLEFTGSLTPAVVDDVLGVFTLQRQPAVIENPEPDSSTATPSASSISENTKEYFKKVVNIAHRVRDYSASNTGERAQWNGNMAIRIDEISTLNVDPEMVQFGAELAKTLRSNMASMQLTNIAMGASAVANDAGTGGFSTATGVGTRAGAYGYGYGYGGNFHDPNSPVKYFQMGQAQGNAAFKQMMAQIEQAISDMRRRMTDKYQIQF